MGALILSVPLLLVLLTGLLALFLDQDHYKAQLSEMVESRTGRPLVIDGALQLAVGMKPRLHAESIRYPNASWGSQPWAIEIDKAVFAVDLWALLRGKLVVEDIVLEKPKLHVEKNAAGVYNLAVLRRSPATADVSLPWRLEVPSVEIIDGEISVATRYRHWDIRIDKAHAESAGPGKPVRVDFAGAVEDTPITASATVGSWETLFTYQPSPLSMDGWVGVADNRVRATGSAQNLLWWRGIDLELDFELANTKQLSALAGTSLPNLGTVVGHARLRQPERFYTMALREIQLQSTKWGLTNTLSGEINRVYNRTGIELNFSASGTLNRAVPGWLMATVGAVDAMPLDTNIAAHLSGSAKALNLRVETAKVESIGLTISAGGEVDFIDGAWRGELPLSLELNPSTESQELPGRALSRIGELTAKANLSREQKIWRLNEIQLSLEREALAVKVTGMVNELNSQPSGHLYVTAEASDGRYLAPLFDDPLPPLSALKLEAALAFERGAWRATVDDFSGRVAATDFSASGAIAELHRLRGIDLAISARADDWQQLPLLPSSVSQTLPQSGQIRGSARLTNDQSGALHLTDLTVSVSGPPIALSASGEIRHLGASMTADLEVELTLSEAESVQAWFADPWATALVEAATPFTASGNLYSSGRAPANWGVRNLKATSMAAAIDASLSGEVAAFAPLEARLHVDINDFAIAQLPQFWNIPHPQGGLLDVSLDLTARGGEVSVKNIIAELNSAAAIKASLSGEVAAFAPLEARLHVDINDFAIAQLPQFWNIPHPQGGLLDVSLDLTARGGEISIKNIIAELNSAAAIKASFSGEVAAFAPLDARLHVDINDFAIAQLPQAWNIPRPQGGLLDVSLDLTARGGEVGVKNIIAELNSAAATMRLHGDIDRLSPIAINNMAMKFQASSVADLEWHTAHFNPDNPIEGIITLMTTGARSNRSTVEVKIGANDLRGTIDWRLPEDKQSPMQVEADLVSERFDLREILLPGAKKTTRFFSNAPINTNWMSKLNGRIHLSAASGSNRLISMRDMQMQMRLDNGTLRQTITGRMGQGDLAMSLVVDATARQGDGQDDGKGDGIVAEFKMHGKQLDTKGLVVFRQDDFVDSGTFDSDIEVIASGASMAELAATANGRVALRLSDARVKNQTLNFIGGDIFSNLVTFIDPFRSVGEYIDIECGIIQFDFAQGVAASKNGLVMKTDKVTLLGAGEIDLRDESLKILLTPKARKGFGINPSALAKVVRLGGTLAKPKIEGDSSRLLEAGATVAATVYSGGLWLLVKGLLDRNQANADVCNLDNAVEAESDSG